MKLRLAHSCIFSTALYGGATGGVALLSSLFNLQCFTNLSKIDQTHLRSDIRRADGGNEINFDMLNSIDRLTLASIAGLDVDSVGYRTCKPNIDDTSIPTLHYEFGTCPLRLQLLSKLVSFDLASKAHDPLLHEEMHTSLPYSTHSLSDWLHILFPDEYDEATRVDDQGKPIHNSKWLPWAIKQRVRSDYFLVENARKSHDQGPSKSALYLLSGFDKTHEYTMKSITEGQLAGPISALALMRTFAFRRRCLYKLAEQHCIPPEYTNQCLLCDERVPRYDNPPHMRLPS